eukprot:gene9656-20082_t
MVSQTLPKLTETNVRLSPPELEVADKGNDDSTTEKETYDEKMWRLKLRKSELKNLLAAVEESLIDSGHLVRQNFQKSGPPQNGIRIKGKLSFRGEEKAKELFDILDSNNDGWLSFEDFRGFTLSHSISIEAI